MIEKMLVGVAGLGFGASVLVPAFRRVNGVQIAALLGRDAERTTQMAGELGIPRACSTANEFLDAQVEAVVLALPPSATAEVAGQALRRGLAVFAEKPLAADAATAGSLAALAHGMTTMVDFEFQEAATFCCLKRNLDAGELGTIHKIGIEWTWPSYAQRARIWSWKTDSAQSGGVLTLFGSHILFLLEWLVGPIRLKTSRLSNVATRRFAPAGTIPADDEAEFVFDTSQGTVISVRLANSGDALPLHRWLLDGSRATAKLENINKNFISGLQLTIEPRAGAKTIAAEESASDDDRLGPCQRLAARFVSAARHRQTVAPDFSAGARVQSLIDEIRSAATSLAG